MTIDAIINEFDKKLKCVQNENAENFKQLRILLSKKEFINTDNKHDEEIVYHPNDLLEDMQFHSDVKQELFNYLNLKHQKKIENRDNCQILTKFEEEQSRTIPDDIVCAVCNSGDYEDNDLIVFCSVSIIQIN